MMLFIRIFLVLAFHPFICSTLEPMGGDDAYFEFYISGDFTVIPLDSGGPIETGKLRCMDHDQHDIKWKLTNMGLLGNVYIYECRGKMLFYGTVYDLEQRIYDNVDKNRIIYRVKARELVLVYTDQKSTEGQIRLKIPTTTKINCENMKVHGRQVIIQANEKNELIVAGDLIIFGTEDIQLNFGYLTVGHDFLLMRNGSTDAKDGSLKVHSNKAFIEGDVFAIGFDSAHIQFEGEWKTKTGEVNVKSGLDQVPRYMRDNIKQIRQSSKTSNVKFSDNPHQVRTFYKDEDTGALSDPDSDSDSDFDYDSDHDL